MPVYDYKCSKCGYEKEVQHSMNEIGKIEVLCDRCDEPMKKMMSAPALVGFDNIGRSVSKKDKKQNGSNTNGKKLKKEAKPVSSKTKLPGA